MDASIAAVLAEQSADRTAVRSRACDAQDAGKRARAG
jgi:hypothetical protein